MTRCTRSKNLANRFSCLRSDTGNLGHLIDCGRQERSNIAEMLQNIPCTIGTHPRQRLEQSKPSSLRYRFAELKLCAGRLAREAGSTETTYQRLPI
jgi:hypothetical protein